MIFAEIYFAETYFAVLALFCDFDEKMLFYTLGENMIFWFLWKKYFVVLVENMILMY